MKKALLLIAGFLLHGLQPCSAQTDTLRVMTYNVLYYGDTPPCQGSHSDLHRYLQTIVKYTRPDVLGLIKMESTPMGEEDKFSTAPKGFPDSIVRYALNAAYNDRYAYCPPTNAAHSNNVEMLFYNKQKLGFVSIVSSYVNLIDFNTYKLYYKDHSLAKTHDTTFLYVTLNHDKSGDEFEPVRGKQIKGEMAGIKRHFTALPNMINMGDFNLRGSDETCYQELVFPDDSNFRFYDPPFYPDSDLKYPANWDKNRAAFAAYLTTSTRQDDMVPNDCGTGGGAKNWYDHIFLSSWIVNNTDHIRYIPHSYRTVGNDGNRYHISVNDKNNVNTSAPAEVIEALYRMSNKYPVMLELEVNTSGHGVANTEKANVDAQTMEQISIANPVGNKMHLHFPESRIGQEITVECVDAKGTSQMKKSIKVKDVEVEIPCKLPPGNYTVQVYTSHNLVYQSNITKQ